MNDAELTDRKGALYIVATPIGNMDDITLRAIKILGQVDYIAAEDTRRTGKLLAYHSIKGRLVSYGEHNEDRRTKDLVKRLDGGHTIALVSDAGTPSISDPGYRLVKAAIEAGVPVLPIPGVSAAMAALSVSGLPTDSFIFIGFLPKKKEKRLRQLRELSTDERTLLFYESPKRIASLIHDIVLTMGNRYGVLGREMTKLHEEFFRDNLTEILRDLNSRAAIKGECTLLVAGHRDSEAASFEAARKDLETALGIEGCRLSEVVKEVAQTHGLSRNRVYQEALKIRTDIQRDDP
jgi:16S rRNA (cytidine1402-2'-O)-methyltransferase